MFVNVTYLKGGCYEGICSLDSLQFVLGLIIIGNGFGILLVVFGSVGSTCG